MFVIVSVVSEVPYTPCNEVQMTTVNYPDYQNRLSDAANLAASQEINPSETINFQTCVYRIPALEPVLIRMDLVVNILTLWI